MLRRAIIAYGVLCLVVAALLAFVWHVALVVAVYLVVNGAIITGALLFERGRYRPQITRGHDEGWQLTGERFVDPTSGQLMEVRYDPATGQRDYVHVQGAETATDGET